MVVVKSREMSVRRQKDGNCSSADAQNLLMAIAFLVQSPLQRTQYDPYNRFGNDVNATKNSGDETAVDAVWNMMETGVDPVRVIHVINSRHQH